MKKENENKKTEFSISKINNIIGKLNKTGILLIMVVYIAVLGLVLSFVGKDINYINEPKYNHVFYDDEITPQISIVGVRNFEDGSQSLKYNVSVNISGRPVANSGSQVDPGYKISNFRMFANTKSKLDDKNATGTYYFTEHTSYKTQVTHSFTVDNSEKSQHPSEFYVRLQYENGETKVSTFKEEVFLQPTQKDIDKMQNWYEENLALEGTEEVKHPSAMAIRTKNESKIGAFQVASYKDTDDKGKENGIYKTGVRIALNDLPETTKKFHIDMQSWILTEDGKYLPFIGVYNYTGLSKKYTNSYTNIDKKLKPAYICAKLVYTDETYNTKKAATVEEMGYDEFYFMQEIDQLKETFPSNPDTGKDAGSVENNNRVLYIVLAASISAVGAVLVIAIAYIIVKKNNKKHSELAEDLDEENNEENQE